MKRPDNTLYLRHILLAIEEIYTDTGNSARDLKTQRAVERNIEIIGEACRCVDDDVKSQYPEVPWARIVGLRNRLSHAYFATDPLTVWNVVEDHLPALEAQIRKILVDLQ